MVRMWVLEFGKLFFCFVNMGIIVIVDVNGKVV